MRKIINIVLPMLLCLLVGLTASYFQSDSIRTWYPYLNKPSLTPPNIVFPFAWSIIYVCMGLSIGLIINSYNKQKRYLIKLFAIQLLFNFLWSISFFYFQSPLLGFINVIFLDFSVLYYAFKSYHVRKASTILFLPYLLWLGFATYLNLYILAYN